MGQPEKRGQVEPPVEVCQVNTAKKNTSLWPIRLSFVKGAHIAILPNGDLDLICISSCWV